MLGYVVRSPYDEPFIGITKKTHSTATIKNAKKEDSGCEININTDKIKTVRKIMIISISKALITFKARDNEKSGRNGVRL